MNPFFFGNSQAATVRCLPSSQSADVRGPPAVVLCYPLWQEYMRAHRAFRQLAMLLSKAGFSVLRFDYFGTGDSAGESDAGDVSRWTHDISTAIDELKDTAGVSKVSLVGLRVGASLAAAVAAERKDLDRIVLWDPVVGGKAYVEKMVLHGTGGCRGTSRRDVRHHWHQGLPAHEPHARGTGRDRPSPCACSREWSRDRDGVRRASRVRGIPGCAGRSPDRHDLSAHPECGELGRDRSIRVRAAPAVDHSGHRQRA